MRKRIKELVGLLAIVADLVLSGCVAGVVDLDDDWDHSGPMEASADFYRDLPVSGQSVLELVGINGTIHIVGVPGIQEVVVSAVRRVRSDSREDAERALADLHISIGSDPGGFEIKTIQPSHSRGRTYVVDYEVTLPSHLITSVTNGNGAVRVAGGRAGVAVVNGNGDVALTDIEGSSWIALGNGDLSSDVLLPAGGEMVYTLGNGCLRLTIQHDVSALLDAEVGNGTITVSGLDLRRVSSTPRQIQGILGAGDGIIDLAVGNGQIRVQGG